MVMRLPMHKTLQLTTACIITITVIGIRPVGLHTKTVVAARGESATSHGNFALGNTGSGLGPFGLGSTTAVLYSNYDASSIQRGDVVQLGRSANDIRHSVIVRTAGSSFENIFVNSHNSKHYNYPLSKYFETYSYIRVIHYRPAFFAN